MGRQINGKLHIVSAQAPHDSAETDEKRQQMYTYFLGHARDHKREFAWLDIAFVASTITSAVIISFALSIAGPSTNLAASAGVVSESERHSVANLQLSICTIETPCLEIP